MDGIYTMASPSSSSLYGNVGCAIRELIVSKFPYDYFKYMNVSTEVAFHNMRRQFGSNTNNEIKKRQFPQLIIQPSYQVPDEDGFLQNIPLTKNIMDIQNKMDRRYLFEVIKDDTYNWALKFKVNRDKIDYDVSINVRSLHNQLDIYKAMINQITWEIPQYYPAALEAILPKTMIQYMSRLCNMDIYTYPEFIPAFLRHLNSVSGYPITYKVKNSSATDEFFMYYQHNLVVTFTDLQLESGNKKGMLDDYYTISFRVSVEFNDPGLFILDGSAQNMSTLQIDIIDKTTSIKGYDDEKDDYIPLYSMSNFYNKFPQRRDGLTLYGSFLFTSDVKADKDYADIGLIIEPEHQKAIRFHTKFGMLDETICKVFILKNREELSSDEFRINWDTMKIEYLHPDTTATYRVAVYMNMEVINADLANPRIDSSYDQHALRENHIDYSASMNETNINLDDSDQDTDFAANSEGSFIDKPIPGIFRGEDLDPERIERNKDMIAMPTSREHEDAWHNMATVPRDNKFDNDIKQVPSDHRDENSFHLMAQESKDVDIYDDVVSEHSNRIDENSYHLMELVPGKEFTSDSVTIQTTSDGTVMAIGEIDLDNLINPSVDRELNEYAKEDSTEEIKESQKEIIMKYYSSIFDNVTHMKAEKEEPVKKYKWASSIEDQEIEENLRFSDSLDPVHIDALNTWTKIIGNAMLYNYATKIAIEDSNNYTLNANGELESTSAKPYTNHLCTCGCTDEKDCTCGWADKIKKK